MKNTTKILKGLKNLRSEIALLENQISYYESLLRLPDLSGLRFTAYNRNSIRYHSVVNSPVEQEVLRNNNSKLNYEIVKGLLNECKSKLLIKKNELSEIEIALMVLTKEEKYIIDCRYDCNMQWRHITTNVNARFRKGYSVTEDAIVKKHKKAIEKIDNLLNKVIFEVPAMALI